MIRVAVLGYSRGKGRLSVHATVSVARGPDRIRSRDIHYSFLLEPKLDRTIVDSYMATTLGLNSSNTRPGPPLRTSATHQLPIRLARGFLTLFHHRATPIDIESASVFYLDFAIPAADIEEEMDVSGVPNVIGRDILAFCGPPRFATRPKPWRVFSLHPPVNLRYVVGRPKRLEDYPHDLTRSGASAGSVQLLG